MKTNETSRFLTPLLGLTSTPVNVWTSNCAGLYIGDQYYDVPSKWGEHFFFVYKTPMSPALDEAFRNNPLFVDTYSPKDDYITYVFKIKEEDQQKVVKPFLEGKYSEVDREYVEKNFPLDRTHRLYANRLVFDKSIVMKNLTEKKIGMELPKEAEVWSRPLEKNEIYGEYYELNDTNPSLAN